MKNFTSIACAIFDKKYSGVFRLRNNEHIPSSELRTNPCIITAYDYPYILGREGKTYSLTGLYFYGKESPFDIVEFIKDTNTETLC